jgi:tetratricopeptide (TPR) repeat protein
MRGSWPPELKTSVVQCSPLQELKYMIVSQILVVTGFHRSATSVVASYLLNAGLNMGEDLMGASINNAKGHFEDWDAVQLHDQFLASSGTNWQFHNECQLQTDMKQLQQYVQQRSRKSDHWGVKDPRACLFLNDWHEVLQEKGQYLFTVRHWSSCIESLLNRESRDLAHLLPKLSADAVGLQFWTKPELAAHMWLSYNKRILAFAKENPERVLLVTQRALFQNAPILSSLNTKFGFSLNTQAASPFQAELLRDQASSQIFDSLSYSLKASLEAVWKAILALTDLKSENEEPLIFDLPVVVPQILASYQQTLINTVEVDYSSEQVRNKSASDWLSALSFMNDQEEIVKYLDAAKQHSLLGLDLAGFLHVISEHFSLNGQIMLSVAKLLMRIKQPVKAIAYFQKVVAAKVYYPYMDMLIGRCNQQQLKSAEAFLFFDNEIKHDPDNPIFYTSKAKCLMLLDLNEQAELAFMTGYEKGTTQTTCVLPYCEYLLKCEREDEALDILEKLVNETRHPNALDMLTRIKLTADYQLGKAYYLKNVKIKLQNKDKMLWLAKTCCFIPYGASEKDFITRIHGHWRDLEDSL